MRRGRVDEAKAATDEHTEVDAVVKGGDDCGLGEGFCGVGDPKIGAEDWMRRWTTIPWARRR